MKIRLSAVPILCFSLAMGASCSAGSQCLVFLSRSMPLTELSDLYRWYEGQENVTLVFRGFAGEQEPGRELAELNRTISSYKKGINIIINPVLFRRYGIESVPSLVITGADGEPAAAVSGSSRCGYLERLMEGQREKFRDYGRAGPGSAIIERDFSEVMKQRILNTDWERKKQQAVEGFWHHRRFFRLEHTSEGRVRRVDPTFITTVDITAGDPPVLLHPAGTAVNPLSGRDFPLRLVVFNPLIPEERRAVCAYLERTAADKNPVKLVADEIDRSDGWNFLTRLEEEFNQHVYLLGRELIDTFALEFTPSVVYRKGSDPFFTVEELGHEN